VNVSIAYRWEDGGVTEFVRGANGSWYAEGLQPMSPKEMLSHLESWVDGTYRVPREEREEA
jgi:hypothetical protein